VPHQICVVDREGRLGWGSSARFELSAKLVAMLKEGKELADVIDEVSGQSDVRSNEGAMGVVTNGNLTVHTQHLTQIALAPSSLAHPRNLLTHAHMFDKQRAEAYSHGVWFAFAPFVSPRKYWE
jgi:non-canonical (house-cleaning) NTP pyrophosphatase